MRIYSEELWLIDFYSPNCGHCKVLEPKWKNAAAKSEGKAKFGKVDVIQNKELQQRYDINAYPEIWVFHEGFDYGKGKED